MIVILSDNNDTLTSGSRKKYPFLNKEISMLASLQSKMKELDRTF
jgi:hypothetical protein